MILCWYDHMIVWSYGLDCVVPFLAIKWQRWVRMGSRVLGKDCFELNSWTSGRASNRRAPWFLYGGGKVKQADVAMLYYPLGMKSTMLQADLDYYSPKYFPDGPAMTDAVNSILHLAAGNA